MFMRKKIKIIINCHCQLSQDKFRSTRPCRLAKICLFRIQKIYLKEITFFRLQLEFIFPLKINFRSDLNLNEIA